MSDVLPAAAIERVWFVEATYAPDGAETRTPFRANLAVGWIDRYCALQQKAPIAPSVDQPTRARCKGMLNGAVAVSHVKRGTSQDVDSRTR